MTHFFEHTLMTSLAADFSRHPITQSLNYYITQLIHCPTTIPPITPFPCHTETSPCRHKKHPAKKNSRLLFFLTFNLTYLHIQEEKKEVL